MKTGHYHRAIGDLKKRLAAAIPHDVLRELHQKSPVRHFAVVARQACFFAFAFWMSWVSDSLWVRVPCERNWKSRWPNENLMAS